MANCPEVTIAYNAIWRAGAVVTPVDLPRSRPPSWSTSSRTPSAQLVLATPELADAAREARAERVA